MRFAKKFNFTSVFTLAYYLVEMGIVLFVYAKGDLYDLVNLF